MQECGACGVAFCSLCGTTILLAEARSTQWLKVHQNACPSVLLMRVLALNEATRVLLVETGAVKTAKEEGAIDEKETKKQTETKQENQPPWKQGWWWAAEEERWLAKRTGFGGERSWTWRLRPKITPEVIRAIERQTEHDKKVRSLLNDGWLPCLATITSSSSTPLLPALHRSLGGAFDVGTETIALNDSTPFSQLL